MSLHDVTAVEQAAAIRSGELTAVELAEHYLARSETVTGAFVALTPDVALAQARAVDAGEVTGPLAGVVCPVKDLFFMRGSSTRFGSVAYDFPAMDDDHVVRAMREAGLVFTGKTTTPSSVCPATPSRTLRSAPRPAMYGIPNAPPVARRAGRRSLSHRVWRRSHMVLTAAARSESPPLPTVWSASSQVGAG